MRTLFLCSTIVLMSVASVSAQVSPRLSEALDLQRALAQQNPGNAEILNDLGNLYGLAGNWEGAEEAYRAAIAADADHATAHYNLALALQESEQLLEASTAMEKAVALTPANARGHYQLGNIYLQRGERELAIESFGRAFRTDPDLAVAEVNPQVIDNPVLTESLLVAYRQRSRAAMAPRLYDRPEKVTDLLVPERELLDQLAKDEIESDSAPPPRRELVTPSKPMFKPPPPTAEELEQKEAASEFFGDSDPDNDGWGTGNETAEEEGWSTGDTDVWGTDSGSQPMTWEDLESDAESARAKRLEERRAERARLRAAARARAAEANGDGDADGSPDDER